MGNDSTTAFRTREQLRKFLGIFSPRFSKPKLEFLGQMLFGIQAARDTLVSEIAHSLQEDILAKKTQERLEHHLQADGLDDKVHGSLLCDAASSIHEDTLIVIDPTCRWSSNFCRDDDGLGSKALATAKTPENRARVREGSVAIFKTGDNPEVQTYPGFLTDR